MSIKQIEFIIVDDIVDEFKKFLGNKYKVIINESYDKWKSSCDFMIVSNSCPLIECKYGWTECGKCLINYNCNSSGTIEFNNLLKKHNCKMEWIIGGLGGIWIKNKAKN